MNVCLWSFLHVMMYGALLFFPPGCLLIYLPSILFILRMHNQSVAGTTICLHVGSRHRHVVKSRIGSVSGDCEDICQVPSLMHLTSLMDIEHKVDFYFIWDGHVVYFRNMSIINCYVIKINESNFFRLFLLSFFFFFCNYIHFFHAFHHSDLTRDIPPQSDANSTGFISYSLAYLHQNVVAGERGLPATKCACVSMGWDLVRWAKRNMRVDGIKFNGEHPEAQRRCTFTTQDRLGR